MPTVEQTERIVHHEGEVIIREVTLSPLSKIFLGILAVAVMGSIAFIVESQFRLKNDIITVHDLIKTDISKMQLLINEGIRTDILTLIARNTSELKQFHNWQAVHEVHTKAVIKEYNMRVNLNKDSIKNIITTKADDRWRRSDEETQNEKMDLVHASLQREIKHNADTLLEKCNLMNIRMENLEKDFDNWTEASDEEYQELHDKIIQHINKEK